MTTIREWTYKGKRCKITKDEDLGHYCGYVQTGLRGNINTTDNKIFHLIDVNGGITYGIDDDGWLGFDCAHSHDICVEEKGELTGEFLKDRNSKDSVVWSPEDVKEEVEDFADQIIALENVIHSVKRFDYNG